MANYTVTQMTAGVLGEVLTGGTAYTFTIATPAYTSQSVYFGAATLTTDSSTITNTNLQGSSTNAKVGALKGGLIPLSNVVDQITGVGANSTFTFDVDGDQQGSSAQIELTATAGTITRANVTRGGQNFTSGDGITISQNDIQAAGFSNADASQQLDLFPDHIEGNYISSNFAGTYANFTTDVSQSNFVSSSCGFSFGIKQSIGNGAGTFDFTPTTTIPVNSYLIKSTGHITLNISPA
jgi:hypothetical protein